MDETILQHILAVQKEMLSAQRGMLAELRHLRQLLTQGATAPRPAQVASAPVRPAPQRTPTASTGQPVHQTQPAPQTPVATPPQPAPVQEQPTAHVQATASATPKAAPQPATAPTQPQPAGAPSTAAPTQPANTPTPEPPQTVAAPTPSPAKPRPEAPETPTAARPAHRAGGMLTMDELADLGGQFLDPGQRSKTRVKPVEAADLSASLLKEIKAKNRAKRDAFAEFERLRRDR